MSEIVLQGVSKRFDDHVAVDGVDLTIEDGSFTVFLGPSGCGKTTLLRLIAGLEVIDSGRLLIDGEDMARASPAKRGLAMVFQSYALYPHMTVRENIGFALKLAKVPKTEIVARVDDVARMLALQPYLDRRPAALSGGQRQRVAIGRAIVRAPRAFLFDEPLSNLDAALRGQMRVEIRQLQKALGVTSIYVTHDQAEAMTMADRIVVFRDGRITQAGAPLEIYDRPANLFVAGFIGSPCMNFIEGPKAFALGARTIGIRPEHIRIVDSGGWGASVLAVEHLGSESFVQATFIDGGVVQIRQDGRSYNTGDTISVSPMLERVHRFDEAGRLMER